MQFLCILEQTLYGPMCFFLGGFAGICYSTPFWGRVYKWKFCLSMCLSVCLSSLLILFLQTLSSRNIPQSTLITQPLPRYLISPHPCLPLMGWDHHHLSIHLRTLGDLDHCSQSSAKNLAFLNRSRYFR